MIEKLRAEVEQKQEIIKANKVEMKTFKEERKTFQEERKTFQEERKTLQEDISEKERIINKMKAVEEENIQHVLILQTIQNISNQSMEK